MEHHAQLPMHLALFVVRKLPPGAQVCAGRRLNHESRWAIPARIVSAREPQLPSWCVEELYQNLETPIERALLLECRAHAG